MSTTIREVAEEFIKKGKSIHKFDKSTVLSLISGDDKYSLYRQDGLDLDMDIANSDAAEYINYAINDSVKAYTRSKQTAITIYRDLLSYIVEKYKIEIEADIQKWIPVTTLERQIQIARILQDPDYEISKLEDELLINRRTIDGDLKKLKGLDDDDALDSV